MQRRSFGRIDWCHHPEAKRGYQTLLQSIDLPQYPAQRGHFGHWFTVLRMDGKSNDLEQMIKALPDCIDFRIFFLETMA